MRNFLGIKGDNTLEKNSLNAIALSRRTCYWGPIIGLRLHGLDPIFKGGLRISTWFFYGLRLQQKVRLASCSVNSRRFTASILPLRLSAEIAVCGKGLLFTPKCIEKSSTSNRSNVSGQATVSQRLSVRTRERERGNVTKSDHTKKIG